MSADVKSLDERLRAVRRSKAWTVVADLAREGEVGEFEFAPAREVREVAERALAYNGLELTVLPQGSSVGRVLTAAARGGKVEVPTSRVDLVLQVTVLASGQSRDYSWVGESTAGVQAAITVGVKNWCLDMRLVTVLDATVTDGERNEERRQKVRDRGALTPSQLKTFVPRHQQQAGLTDDETLAVANRLLPATKQITTLEDFPRRLADDLARGIVESGKRKTGGRA